MAPALRRKLEDLARADRRSVAFSSSRRAAFITESTLRGLNGKVTLVTVSAPFHAFASEPGMVTDTREEYEQHVAACAANYLRASSEAGSRRAVGQMAQQEQAFESVQLVRGKPQPSHDALREP
jgi:hypothetical protein